MNNNKKFIAHVCEKKHFLTTSGSGIEFLRACIGSNIHRQLCKIYMHTQIHWHERANTHQWSLLNSLPAHGYWSFAEHIGVPYERHLRERSVGDHRLWSATMAHFLSHLKWLSFKCCEQWEQKNMLNEIPPSAHSRRQWAMCARFQVEP